MGRLISTMLLLLAAAIVLPAVAAAAGEAIPFLVALLAGLLLWRLVFPARARRR